MDLYASDNPDMSSLHAIIKYLSLLPKARSCTAFYLQPHRKWFGKASYINCPAGINKLCNIVREMCHDAGLSSYYTNHYLCSTAAMKVYRNRVDEQLIIKNTGHRSTAICSYKRTCMCLKALACIALCCFVVCYIVNTVNRFTHVCCL